MTVLIGARDVGRGRDATGGLRSKVLNAHFIQLDVTSQEVADQAARRIAAEFGGLDILVNNAGIVVDDAPPSGLDREVLHRTYETNVFGSVALIKVMLPLLRRSATGRIVDMSSGLGSLASTSDPDWQFADTNLPAYNSSKTALNAITARVAKELRDTPIKVNAADPGYTTTDMNNHRQRSPE